MKAYGQSSGTEKGGKQGRSMWNILALVFSLVMLLAGVAAGDGEMVWISLICLLLFLVVKPSAPASNVPAAPQQARPVAAVKASPQPAKAKEKPSQPAPTAAVKATPQTATAKEKPSAAAQPAPATAVKATPQATTTKEMPSAAAQQAPAGFEAGGKHYSSAKELRWQATKIEDKYADVYKDVHGRWVVRYTERYPCFDSSDFLYEDRYYRYYLIVADVQAGEPQWTKVCFPDAEDQPEWVSNGLQLTMLEAGCTSLMHPLLRRVDLLARLAYLQAEEEQQP